MLHDITRDKVEEVIELAREAAAEPHDPTASHREPITHEPPLRPQPAADWAAALTRYLHDLPVQAVVGLEALYRYGRGDGASVEEALRTVCAEPKTEQERVAFLASRPDLPDVLERALDRGWA